MNNFHKQIDHSRDVDEPVFYSSTTQEVFYSATASSKRCMRRSTFKYLPESLDDPLPSNWTSIEDEFVFFLVSNVPVLAANCMIAPEAKFADKCMHLIFVRADISKLHTIELLTKMETADFLDSPFVEHVKIRAFRLEPLNSPPKTESRQQIHTSHMIIDGERVACGRVQAEIMPELANTLAHVKVI